MIWGDSDGDGIPDWQGFGGVQVTDEEGYYKFAGLQPGNYLVFVWSVDNWELGQPLHGFQSTNGFVADADNDVDLDNNGFGAPFTDIMSGIVTLTLDGEPLDDGDPFNCFFDYDASGNNTVDFGFFDPNFTAIKDGQNINNKEIQIFPNPTQNEFRITGNLNQYQIQLIDSMGKTLRNIKATGSSQIINISSFPQGLYFIKILNKTNDLVEIQKIVKLDH